jgi:hypothetical protein
MSSTTKAEHLRAHASRLQVLAYQFRHSGHDLCATELAAQAGRYREEAARLEVTQSRAVTIRDLSIGPAPAY